MSYHQKMMNIEHPYFASMGLSISDEKQFKLGHKYARHSAAEIALEADKRIAELERALMSLVQDMKFLATVVPALDSVADKALKLLSGDSVDE